MNRIQSVEKRNNNASTCWDTNENGKTINRIALDDIYDDDSD